MMTAIGFNPAYRKNSARQAFKSSSTEQYSDSAPKGLQTIVRNWQEEMKLKDPDSTVNLPMISECIRNQMSMGNIESVLIPIGSHFTSFSTTYCEDPDKRQTLMDVFRSHYRISNNEAQKISGTIGITWGTMKPRATYF